MNLATIETDNRPHSSTVWASPDEDLNLYWLSAPSRMHSQHIDGPNASGKTAYVSGSLYIAHRPSRPVTGLTVEGTASRLTEPEDMAHGMRVLLDNRAFFSDEAERYLQPSEGEVPAHGFYILRPTEWTIFDGHKKNRITRIEWPQHSSNS